MNIGRRFGFQRLLILVALTVLGGCSSVTMLQPLPRAEGVIDQERLSGEWVSGDQVIYVRFGGNGIGQFAGLDWKDDRFQVEIGELIVSAGHEHNFFSVRVQEKGKWEEQYYFAQYRFTDQGDLVVWQPEVAAFEKAVEAGRLEGTVQKGSYGSSVTLTGAPDVILTFIDNPENDALFEYKDPMVFKRLVLEPAGPQDD